LGKDGKYIHLSKSVVNFRAMHDAPINMIMMMQYLIIIFGLTDFNFYYLLILFDIKKRGKMGEDNSLFIG